MSDLALIGFTNDEHCEPESNKCLNQSFDVIACAIEKLLSFIVCVRWMFNGAKGCEWVLIQLAYESELLRICIMLWLKLQLSAVAYELDKCVSSSLCSSWELL